MQLSFSLHYLSHCIHCLVIEGSSLRVRYIFFILNDIKLLNERVLPIRPQSQPFPKSATDARSNSVMKVPSIVSTTISSIARRLSSNEHEEPLQKFQGKTKHCNEFKALLTTILKI